MADVNTLVSLNGALPRSAIYNFWTPNLYGVDPEVPAMPLETNGFYLWRIAPAFALVALAACQAPEIRRPAVDSWPFGTVTAPPPPSAQPFHIWQKPAEVRLEPEPYGQPVRYSWPWNRFAQPFQPLFFSGVPKFPVVQWASLQPVEVRQPAPLSWPFAMAPAGGPSTQPFHIWQKPAEVRLEPEGYRQPTVSSWPWNRFAQPSQPFHAWRNPPLVRLEVEAYGQPVRYSWPWNRFAQPFQPLFFYGPSKTPRLDVEPYAQPWKASWPFSAGTPVVSGVIPAWDAPSIILLPSTEIRQPAKLSWPFGRTAGPTTQPFHIWQKPAQVRLEVEAYGQPVRYSWPWNRFAQPSQPFHAWRNPPLVRLEVEAYGQPVRYSWPWDRFVQPFQILLTWPGITAARALEPETYTIAQQAGAWPFGRAVSYGQPFMVWAPRRPVVLEDAGFIAPATVMAWPFGNSYAVPLLVGSHLVVYPCEDRTVEPGLPRTVRPKR